MSFLNWSHLQAKSFDLIMMGAKPGWVNMAFLLLFVQHLNASKLWRTRVGKGEIHGSPLKATLDYDFLGTEVFPPCKF